MGFQSRLRALRAERGMNQTALAQAIGVTLKQIQRYELGHNEPTLSVLVSLADAFDVSLDYLVGRSDVPERR